MAPAAALGRYQGPERLHLAGDHLYVDYVEGVARPKLPPAFLAKALGVPATARNWNTTRKLLELARALAWRGVAPSPNQIPPRALHRFGSRVKISVPKPTSPSLAGVAQMAVEVEQILHALQQREVIVPDLRYRPGLDEA